MSADETTLASRKPSYQAQTDNRHLEEKSQLVIIAGASATARNTPDTAFTQKPAHIIGKSFSIGATGRSGAKPSTRRSIAVPDRR